MATTQLFLLVFVFFPLDLMSSRETVSAYVQDHPSFRRTPYLLIAEFHHARPVDHAVVIHGPSSAYAF